MKLNFKSAVFILLLLFIGVIALLHAYTPGYLVLYHDTYRRLSYFPIAIGAILYGVRGGVSLAIISSLAFVPHLYLFWARGPQAYYSELSEILFYLSAGLVIGLISSRENRLREKYKTLSEKLAASYQRLHEQAARLVAAEKLLGRSRKLSMLGRVSASLAHEIKNPLASIKGAAEILADEVPKGHSKYEFIEIIRAEISRLNRSVEDVLSYCRGEQHREEGKKEDIPKIISRVALLVESAMKEKSIRFSVESHPDIDAFKADKDALHQVVMNILINAVDAVDKGGCIQIELSPEEQGSCITVLDDGPGIDADKAEQVFHSFVTFKDGGTGLGLSISKRIVESLGGRITIERSALGGAAFRVFLPGKPYSEAEGI